MTHPSRHRRRSKLRSWYVWHRWLGVSAALLVTLLALTGIALNHTEALRLDERTVHAEPILAWYGIEPPGPLVSYEVGGQRLTQAGAHWYLQTEPLAGEFAPLRGAVSMQPLLAAASSDAVWLLTEQGEVVERMAAEAGVPEGVRRLGRHADGHLVLDAASGYFRSDSEIAHWQKSHTEPATVRWSAPTPVPQSLRTSILHRHRGAGLSLERVLLDLHSGRLLGNGGVYVMDAAAIVMLVLAGSGTWLWLGGLLRRRRR